MRKQDSFRDFEKSIYQQSLKYNQEKLFLTDGKLSMEIGMNGTKDGVDVNLTKEEEFIRKSSGVFVYSYHTHVLSSLDVHLNKYLAPPSFEDFRADKNFRNRASENGKRIISRALEKQGVWQYACNPQLLPPINLNEMIQNEKKFKGTLKERVDRLIKGYNRFGVPNVKFFKRDLF